MDTHCRKCKSKTPDEDKKYTRKHRRIWLSSCCGICHGKKGRWFKREKPYDKPEPKPEPEPEPKPELEATTSTDAIQDEVPVVVPMPETQ